MAKPKKGGDPAPVEKSGDQVNSGDKPEEKAGTDQGTDAEAEAVQGAIREALDDGAIKGVTAEEVAAEVQAEEEALEIDPVDQSAFDKRLERLFNIADEVEFESGTLVGDIRDFLIEDAKHRPKPWSQMSNAQQRDFAKMAEEVAKKIIRKVVIVVAEEDEVTVHATLKGYSADAGTFKLKLVARGDLETAEQLFKLDGHDVVLISAEAKRFLGQRKDPPLMPDQGGLEFADPPAKSDAAPAEITHPPGSEDLASAGTEVADARGPVERVNLDTGMIEGLKDDFDRSTVPVGDAWPDEAFEEVREATAEELEEARQARIAEEEANEEVRVDIESGNVQTLRGGDLHHEEEATGEQLVEEWKADPPEGFRINLKTGMIESLSPGQSAGDPEASYVDHREARPEELAFERERSADFPA